MIINEWIEITDEVKPPIDQEEILFYDRKNRRKSTGIYKFIESVDRNEFLLDADLWALDLDNSVHLNEYFRSIDIAWFMVVSNP